MTEQRTREDWTKPAAMAIPKGGFDPAAAQQGRYGPVFPKSPTCYGFSILAKIIPGREEVFYGYAKTIEKTIAAQPDALAVLKLHYLRWVLFRSRATLISCTKVSSTPISTSTRRTRSRFSGRRA